MDPPSDIRWPGVGNQTRGIAIFIVELRGASDLTAACQDGETARKWHVVVGSSRAGPGAGRGAVARQRLPSIFSGRESSSGTPGLVRDDVAVIMRQAAYRGQDSPRGETGTRRSSSQWRSICVNLRTAKASGSPFRPSFFCAPIGSSNEALIGAARQIRGLLRDAWSASR